MKRSDYLKCMQWADEAIWSTVWSTIAREASGRAAYGDIIQKPDLRLGYGFCQFDGFNYAGG